MKISTLLCIPTLALLLLSCDFRRSDEGYDPDWKPDHEAPANEEDGQPAQTAKNQPGTAEDDPSADSERKRPAEIAADTVQMTKTTGTWEMVNVEKSYYKAYRNRDEIAMIVEETEASTRAYYFDGGALFYYNEESNDGSQKLTVEFDDIGDIVGARKTVNGGRVDADIEDYGDIVEHAVELKVAADE